MRVLQNEVSDLLRWRYETTVIFNGTVSRSITMAILFTIRVNGKLASAYRKPDLTREYLKKIFDDLRMLIESDQHTVCRTKAVCAGSARAHA